MKRYAILAVLFFAALCITAMDFTLFPNGFALFPAGAGNLTDNKDERYDIGGGGGLGLDADISSVLSNPLGIGYTVGVEGGVLSSPYKEADGSLNFYSFGGGLGLYYYPLSRIPIRVDGGIGVYNADDGTDKAPPGMWLRFGGETGFRFTPSFTLTAGAGWRQFKNTDSGKALNSGVYAGLGARITFEVGKKSSGGTAAIFTQDDSVFPVLTPLYQQYPIGSIKIRNQETAEIRNVRLFFRAGNYSASEYLCGEIGLIPKGRSAELPMLADFSPEILRFSDSGRILGEIIVRYSFLGRERETVRTVSVAVHNRNTVAPGDNAALAAFVSPTSPEVLQFAKYVAGLARQNHRMGLNINMEFGVWLFEGMKAAGIHFEETPVEEAQFPAQTLAYGSGSVRDVTLLYMAVMESVGVRAGFIVMPDGELLGAVNLGINANDAATAALFNGPDKLLIAGDEVWVPMLMSKLSDGFSVAWREGIKRMDDLLDSGESAEMIIIEDAWESYPPVPFPALGIRITPPDNVALTSASNAALQSYISSEFPPKLADIQRQIQSRPTALLYNQLGNLQLRSGNISQAKSAYEQAAGMGSVGAMANRGNIALNENDTAAAERWFRQALAREPENITALRGIEFVEVRK